MFKFKKVILAAALTAFGTLSLAQNASAQETARFTGALSYDATLTKGAISVTAYIGEISNVSSQYATYPLTVEFKLCNKPYSPKTAKSTFCSTVATQNLDALNPLQYFSGFSISSYGPQRVKKGTYIPVLIIGSQSARGYYDYINFKKKLTIK